MPEILVVALAYFAAVLAHEAGHALAGKMLGFDLEMFAVWPFCLGRKRSEWKLVRYHPRASGFVSMTPRSATRLRSREIRMIAAGPAASLAVAMGGGLVVQQVERAGADYRLALFVNAVRGISLLIALISLLPLGTPIQTDGLLILRLMRGDHAFLRAWALRALWFPGSRLRPREYDPELVSLALDETVRLPVNGMNSDARNRTAVEWAKYNWYADTGCIEPARAALEWLLVNGVTARDRSLAGLEAVWFEIFSCRDLPAALKRWRDIEYRADVLEDPLAFWKAKAALAQAQGLDVEAELATKNARLALAKATNLSWGLAKAIEDDLSELLARTPMMPALGDARGRSGDGLLR